MLYIVLVLVLGAFGLLIAALTTAQTVWAWISVAISLVAATLLVLDWLKGRRRAAGSSGTGADEPGEQRDDAGPGSDVEHGDVEHGDVRHGDGAGARQDDDEVAGAGTRDVPEPGHPAAAEPDAEDPLLVDSRAAESRVSAGDVPLDEDEPGEESTDAADLLVVAELTAEVRVVDERPRYHLARCRWLASRGSIPLPVAEARQLGFTPCVVCGPDAELSARHRAGRGPRRRSDAP